MRFEMTSTPNPHKSFVEEMRFTDKRWVVLYTKPDGQVNFYVNEAERNLDVVLSSAGSYGTPVGVSLAAPGYPLVLVGEYNVNQARWELKEGLAVVLPDDAATAAPEPVAADPERRVYWLVADEDQNYGVAHKVAVDPEDAAREYFSEFYDEEDPYDGASIWVVREDDAKIFRFEVEEIIPDPEYVLNVTQTR